MIDESFRGTVVLFAVEREAKPFLRSCRDARAISSDRWLCDKGRLLVEIVGVGKPSARSNVEALLATGCRPQQIIVAGFAGALRGGLAVGDVIVAAEVVDESGGRWPTTWPDERNGRVLTTDRMIGEPALKTELGIKHAADIVEMESSAVAEVCVRHGIPFGCVRVVSDDVSKPLSKRLMGLVESGRVRIIRVLWEVLRSPGMGIELVRLAKQTRMAAEKLTARLNALLARFPS